MLTAIKGAYGQNSISRRSGLSNITMSQSYNINDNNIFQSNNTNVFITNNTNYNSRNFIQKSNDNIQNNTSRNNPVVLQSRGNNVNSNPINLQQRSGNVVIEQRSGYNIAQQLIEPRLQQDIVRNDINIVTNEMNINEIRNQDFVTQENNTLVSEVKEDKLILDNQNEINLVFSFPKIEISKEEKVDLLKKEKEIVHNLKANSKNELSFQKKKNTTKSKKIRQSRRSKSHFYQQKVRGQKIVLSKLKKIKNTKLKAKTKKPYCRVVCYKF